MESTDSAFPELIDMDKTKRGILAGAAGCIAAVSAFSSFDAVSQHGFEAGAWLTIFAALTVSALAAVSFLSLTDRDEQRGAEDEEPKRKAARRAGSCCGRDDYRTG